MKNLLKNGVLIVLTVGLLYVIFLRECKTKVETVVQTDTIVGPSLVIYDTIYITIEKPVYIVKNTVSYDTVYIDSSRFMVYNDSIVNDSIRFWQDIWVNGTIGIWNQRYEPIIVHRDTRYETPVYIKSTEIKRELFLSGILSGNVETFSPGVSLDYVNKKRHLYGVSVQYLNGKPLYGFRIGAKILPR